MPKLLIWDNANPDELSMLSESCFLSLQLFDLLFIHSPSEQEYA